MLLSSRAVVLWVLLKLWLHGVEHPPSTQIFLLWPMVPVCDELAPCVSRYRFPWGGTAGWLSALQTDLQTTGVPGQAAGFNLILFGSMWQILEIGKARVSLLHDLGLSSKWEFKIKGNSTSIWEFLCNCCFSQMICEIPSGLKILHAA